MRSVGITAEYNPFHFGHQYQIEKIREKYGADTPITAVLSGDFVQRGEAAAYDKYTRAEAAVRCGVSLVLELPLPWCIASAEGFARGGVGLLAAAGVVDTISFGSESADLTSLEKTASALETDEFSALLKAKLADGRAFAPARAEAAHEMLGEAARVLDTPNDLLGTEYIRAAKRLGCTFNYYPVQRTGSVHDGAGSASALRAVLREGGSIAESIPEAARSVLAQADAAGRGYVPPESLRMAYLSRLREKTPEDFAAVPDAGEGLHYRLYEASRTGGSIEEMADAAKSKRYAHARLRRMLLCAALGVRAGDADGVPPYIRALAFDERGAALLREMKTAASLPVIVKSSRIKDESARAQYIFSLTSRAHDFFVLGRRDLSAQAADEDYRFTPIYCPRSDNSSVG